MSTTTRRKTAADYAGTSVIVHRSSRALALAYIARHADVLGDQHAWNGAELLPIHVTWDAAKSATGGFDVVQTITPR